MAHLYRVVYHSTSSEPQKAVNVSATSTDNAITAAKTADTTFKQVINVSQVAPNLIIGS